LAEPAEETDIGNGVVRRTKRARRDKCLVVDNKPQMLWIFVDSIASSRFIGGMIVANRFAIIDLPEPGDRA
jgi:hypothetical protein